MTSKLAVPKRSQDFQHRLFDAQCLIHLSVSCLLAAGQPLKGRDCPPLCMRNVPSDGDPGRQSGVLGVDIGSEECRV